MKYDLILVRYGEIALKGKYTRLNFERQLVKNICSALKRRSIENKILRDFGRIYIITNEIWDTIEVLKKIFGVISVSPAIKTKSVIDSIIYTSTDLAKKILTDKTSFAIRSTRVGEHNFTSQEIAVKVGENIIKKTKAPVNLTNPDFEIFIEIRDADAFIFTEKIYGTGGMPLGTQGNILALIDDEKSLLASWFLMKRGCANIFLIIDKSYEDKTKILSDKYFSDFVSYDLDCSEENLYEKINEIIKEEDCRAVVTGYCFCGNIEFEIKKLKELYNRINAPILCPLISMEEEEIEKKYIEIGMIA